MTPAIDWPAAYGAPPIYATPRNLERRSEGAQVGVIARTLGTPLIPWQRYVAEVAGERRPDGSYEYQVVVVTVPRQTGKTTLIRAVGTHRCLACGRDVFYTAQTGKDARARWLDLVKILRVNPALADRVKISLRGGSENIEFLDTGAAFHVFAPSPRSLHSYTPPCVFIDEAFFHTGMAGELLMGAIGPGQLTLVDKQIWIVSTAGTAESTFLHDWIDRALEGTPRVAGFYWGARDDQNPYDLNDITAFHPGVGFPFRQVGSKASKILTAADVLAEVEKHSRAEYERAFGNRRTVTSSHLIPLDRWRTLKADDFAPPASTRDVVLTYEVAHDRQAASIVAGWKHGERRRVKIVQAREGTSWLAAAVAELDRDWRPAKIVAAGNGPALETTDKLKAYGGVAVDVLDERSYATASTAFLNLIDDALLEHDGDPVLEASVTGLVTRNAGDGLAFSRRHSIGDSSAGIGAALSAWQAGRVVADRILMQFGDPA